MTKLSEPQSAGHYLASSSGANSFASQCRRDQQQWQAGQTDRLDLLTAGAPQNRFSVRLANA
jgi:hypothetical protein